MRDDYDFYDELDEASPPADELVLSGNGVRKADASASIDVGSPGQNEKKVRKSEVDNLRDGAVAPCLSRRRSTRSSSGATSTLQAESESRIQQLEARLAELQHDCPNPFGAMMGLQDIFEGRWPGFEPDEQYPEDDHGRAGNCRICGWNHEHVYIFWIRRALYGNMRSADDRAIIWADPHVYVKDLIQCVSHPHVESLIPLIARRLNVKYACPGDEGYAESDVNDLQLPGLDSMGTAKVRLAIENAIVQQDSTANFPQSVLGSLMQDKHVPGTLQDMAAIVGMSVPRRRSSKQRKVVAHSHEHRLVLFWLKHWLPGDALDEDGDILQDVYGILVRCLTRDGLRRFNSWAKDNFQWCVPSCQD